MTEEGRVRSNSGGSHTYDYFLKDHLGNIRVVLSSDATQPASDYPAASMEIATSATETTFYSNLDKVRNFTPVGFTSLKKNEKVAHLKGTDPNKQIGPSITVKVNSGDKVSLTAQSFYPDNSGSQRTGLAETALSQLVSAMINPAGLNAKGKAIATERLKAQGFEGDAGYRGMMNKLPNSDYANENDRPKAFMVWMLFDNEMRLVKTGRSSGARQIPEGAGQVKQMAENEIVMDQGGFLTAYTVNESPASVYIDNFQLSVAAGKVLEINNYYPFGMINNGITDPGFSDPLNNYKYNGKELQKELNLEWLDYGARFYDPQIGRWHSVDPLSEKARRWSPYTYCEDNPIRFIDPDGMEPEWVPGTDGKRVSYTMGKDGKAVWSSNASISVRVYGKGLLLNAGGKASLDNVLNNNIKTHINVLPDVKIAIKDGETKTTTTTTWGETTQGNNNKADNYGRVENSDGTTGIKEATINIYTGSIKESIQPGSGTKIEGLSEIQAIGAVSIHENTHGSDKSEINKDIKYEAKHGGAIRSIREVKANQVEQKFIDTEKNKSNP